MDSQIKFYSIIFGIFIIITTVINNNPKAQFLQRPQQGSFSAARNRNYGQQIGIGDHLGLSSSLSKSKTISQTNDGRNVAKSKSLTQGGNIGNLGISSTLTGTKSKTNGQLSGGIGHELNVGGVGLGSSISTDNLKSIGLHRNSNGGAELGLGLLKLDLSRGANPISSGQTATNAGATGDIANARAKAEAKKTNFGLFDLTSTNSKSKSFGASRTGQTTANAGGNAGGNAGVNADNSASNARSQGFGFPFLGRKKRDLGKYYHQNYVTVIDKPKPIPCSAPKICKDGKQSEGRTFGLIFDSIQALFAPVPPIVPSIHPPPPIHPPPRPIPHHPFYPQIKPCCYSCLRPTYSNCRFHPSHPGIISGGYGTGGHIYPSPGLLYGGLYNGGLYGGGYYGGGSYGIGAYGPASFQASGGNPLTADQYASSSANGVRNGQSSGTVLDIGPISYSSSTSNIGTTLLQMLFG